MKKTIEPGKTPAAWDPEALFAKAQRCAEQMIEMDADSWQHGLMASLSLELLARAALANVSPVLLTDPNQAWVQTYHALGYPALEARAPSSIATGEVLKRLAAIFPTLFTKEVSSACTRITGNRNAELHSGETPFDDAPTSTWQPQFYEACAVLLATMGYDLHDLFGKEEAEIAAKLIAAAADKSAKAVAGDIEAHRKVWEAKDENERKKEREAAALWAVRRSGHRVDCPACGSPALLFGDPVSAPQLKLKDDEITETQEYLPTHFECVACGLKINGLSRLNAAGLGGRFKRTSVYDAAEYYAPEETYPDFEDDNNEPF